MAEKNFNHIPKDKFTFVNEGERLTDQKFEDKPVSYFRGIIGPPLMPFAKKCWQPRINWILNWQQLCGTG